MATPTEHPAQNGPFPAESRQEIRRRCLAARTGMPAEAHAIASQAIEDHLFNWLSPRPPGVIGFCWPIRGEFDARPLAHRLGTLGWGLAMPVVTQKCAPLVWRPWHRDTRMTVDEFGIPTPAGEEEIVPQVLLIPLVAFDDAGYRLGYGGGYFDRSLASLSPRPETIGVGFELGRVNTICPEPHDIPMNSIVTEAGVWVRNVP